MTTARRCLKRGALRFKGYDYTQPGGYYITICTSKQECLFGTVRDGEMKLNDAGHMVEKWWKKLLSKFPLLKLYDFVIMPNHIHGILYIVPPSPSATDIVKVSLVDILYWFKTMTTNEYIRNVRSNNWPPFRKRLWHRSYFDRIIKNDSQFYYFQQYIINNPANWDADEHNPSSPNRKNIN